MPIVKRKEEWRDVPGTKGKWRASDKGRLQRNGRLIVPLFTDSNPYKRVGILGHVMTVGSVVLETFIGPRPDGMDCCHYDDNKTNDILSNLRWDTRKNNMRDCFRNGNGHRNPMMTAARVILARLLHRQFPNIWGNRLLARLFGVPHSTMNNALIRNSWRHLP